jgi:PAS domain S-box-containing protein
MHPDGTQRENETGAGNGTPSDSETLRQRDAILAAALNLPGAVFFVLDPQGSCVETSEQTARRLSHRTAPIVGNPVFDLFAPENAARLRLAFNEAMRTGEPWEGVLEQGGFWFQFRLAPVPDAAGIIRFLTLLGFDLTRQYRAEEQLRLGEKRLRQIIDLVPYFIFAKDATGRFILANQATADVYGTTVENLLQRTDADFDYSEEEVRHFREDDLMVIRSGRPKHVTEEQITDSLGQKRHLSTVKIPFTFSGTDVPAVLGVSVDITERKQAEAERLEVERRMLKAQKLESLGVMAGGIAHDFNNLLTCILGHAQLAEMNLQPKDPIRENLREVEKASRRAADLCAQMMTYAGGQGQLEEESVDLNHLIRDMMDLLRTSITKKCVLHMDLHPDLPAITGNAGQVRQILMNLVINASEALGEKGGRISLSTGIGDNGNEPQGRSVWMEVADTGCGMDEETRRKVFDPFFSTKFTGRGLGLSTVAGIVRAHGGTIELTSAPGQGTAFRIRFPTLSAAPGPRLSETAEDEAWRGSGTVLLADDEEGVRKMGKLLLEQLGFGVLTAQDGQEALDVYRRNRNRIRFTFLDLTMPRMDGGETFEAIREIDPEALVILTSGYSETDLTEKFSAQGLFAFLHKPYSLSDLRQCAKSCLAGAAENGVRPPPDGEPEPPPAPAAQ